MPTAEGLFRRYHLPVYRFFARRTGDAGWAEDLTQDVFLNVVRSMPDDLPVTKERSWVFVIAMNALRNSRRDRVRRPFEGSEFDAQALHRSPLTTERLELEEALAGLPVDQRDVFLLREIGGLTYSEIGEACGIAADLVRSRICRARLALRESLSKPVGKRSGR